MIHVFLVEDQTLVREGLRSLLGLVDDIDVVGEAVDGQEAIERIPVAEPDVVLLDYRLPIHDGIEVIRQLRKRGELRPTIILTTFDDDTVLFDGIRAGARGFLLKDVSLEKLAGAIREVAAGGTLIQPALTERILQGLDRMKTRIPGLEPIDSLTERETEVLRLVAGGYSNREIADALFLAEGTVKNHLSSILAKLGVRDRTRAVLKAVELGFLG